MQPADVGVTVLARAPEPGRVKTRLAASLGDERACEVHRALALDTLDQVSRWLAARGATGGSLVLALTGQEGASLDFEAEVASELPFELRFERQGEGALGARMREAVERRLAEGFGLALVAGTDCPFLATGALDEAASALARAEVVLVPALDGGFVLLGARRSWGDALELVEWGTSSVLHATADALRGAGLVLEIAGPPEEDVDDLASLQRTVARLKTGPWSSRPLLARLAAE